MIWLTMAALAGPPKTSVVVFVRHAEKAKDGTRDPDLTDEGRERAQCLVSVLSLLEPTQLVASEYQRTQKTIQPTADALRKELTVLPAGEPDRWIETLRAAGPGAVTVMAAHSNTIPALVQRLGTQLNALDPKGHIPEDQYDRLVHVTLDKKGRALSAHTTRYCVK